VTSADATQSKIKVANPIVELDGYVASRLETPGEPSLIVRWTIAVFVYF
jgi:hypothetical protein